MHIYIHGRSSSSASANSMDCSELSMEFCDRREREFRGIQLVDGCARRDARTGI